MSRKWLNWREKYTYPRHHHHRVVVGGINASVPLPPIPQLNLTRIISSLKRKFLTLPSRMGWVGKYMLQSPQLNLTLEKKLKTDLCVLSNFTFLCLIDLAEKPPPLWRQKHLRWICVFHPISHRFGWTGMKATPSGYKKNEDGFVHVIRFHIGLVDLAEKCTPHLWRQKLHLWNAHNCMEPMIWKHWVW